MREEAVAALCGKWSRHVRHDRHVLSQEGLEKLRKGLSACRVLTSLSLMMFSLLKRYCGRGWWLRGLHSLRVDVMPFSPLLLPGRSLFAGAGECFVFAFTPVCYTPQLGCSVSAVNLLGQQVLIRCTTDHTAQQLFTHCCVCTRSQWAQTQTRRYLSQATSTWLCTVILGVIALDIFLQLCFDFEHFFFSSCVV